MEVSFFVCSFFRFRFRKTRSSLPLSLPFASLPIRSVQHRADPHPSSSSRARADVGKILAGIQVPPAETPAFEQWLQGLQYPFVEETDNQVYRDFLDDVELDLDLGTEGEAEGEEGKGEE